jgi:hypothetical protein
MTDDDPPREKKAGTAKQAGFQKLTRLGINAAKDTVKPLEWEYGLTSNQIAAVKSWRATNPSTPLPASLQRQLARAWRAAA